MRDDDDGGRRYDNMRDMMIRRRMGGCRDGVWVYVFMLTEFGDV